jgi:8-oxo-dGTP diphosphatase
MPYTYDYPRPALAIDCVIFGYDPDAGLQVALIQRGEQPFIGKWALPGGFVREGESLEFTARRELKEETGISSEHGNVFLEQLYTFGEPERDPRYRVVSVSYYALVKLSDHEVRAATDSNDAAWFSTDDLPDLAFDHDRILETGLQRLKGKVRYQPIGFELLPPKFTLTQLQHIYEAILERTLDKRNFRKKILGLEFVADTGEIQKDVAHRAAKLYQFDQKIYERLVKQGINFEI